MELALVAAGSYLIGGINPAYFITRCKKGVDIRDCGTGNAGATNAMFAIGLKLAVQATQLAHQGRVAAVLAALVQTAQGPDVALAVMAA